MLETITLTARRVDAIHFVFIPGTWVKQLKPISKAQWKHEVDPAYGLHNYEIKAGVFLVFPQYKMTNGGFYAAHLYDIIKNLDCKQVHATLTMEGLTLETIGGENKTRIIFKPRGLSRKDTPFHAILNY
jgi:hypothetical protein